MIETGQTVCRLVRNTPRGRVEVMRVMNMEFIKTSGGGRFSKYIIVVFSGTGAKKSVLAWDVARDAAVDKNLTKDLETGEKFNFDTPCDFDDSKFQGWYKTLSFVASPEREELFDSYNAYLRWDEALQPTPPDVYKELDSLCPDLVPAGSKDWWRNTVVGSGDGSYDDWDIKAAGDNAGYYDEFYRPVTTVYRRGVESFGVLASRVGHNLRVDADKARYSDYYWTFAGPFGELGTFHATNKLYTPGAFGLPGNNSNTYYDMCVKDRTTGLPWYWPVEGLGSNVGIAGRKVNDRVVQIHNMHFVGVNGYYEIELGSHVNWWQTPDATRTIWTQAQALYFEGGYGDTPLKPEGNNLAFSAKVSESVEKYYEVNSLGDNVIHQLTMDIKFPRNQ